MSSLSPRQAVFQTFARLCARANVLDCGDKDVDARHEAGHDECGC